MTTIEKGLLAAGALAMTTALTPLPAAAQDETSCGTDEPISVVEMTWLSAGTLAYVTETILAEGYGCNVEIVPGDTVPTATSMLTKSEPDIAPELWITTAQSIWNQIQEKGNVYKASEIFTEGGVEGWWIPDYVAEQNPDLKSISDLKDNWELFAERTSPDEGRFYGCPPGWACEITTTNLFEALNLGENYELFSPGSGANLKASIARKVTRQEPVVAYYWGPTAVIGRYNLVKLDMPAYDAEAFECLTDSECQDPQPTAFKPAEVAVAVVESMKERAPNVTAMLEKMQVPNDVMNDVLAWGDENSASPEATAEYFLENYEDVWTDWVPDAVAEKVRQSIG